MALLALASPTEGFAPEHCGDEPGSGPVWPHRLLAPTNFAPDRLPGLKSATSVGRRNMTCAELRVTSELIELGWFECPVLNLLC